MSNLHEAAKQALDFCEFLWREVAMNDYAEEKRESVEAALRAALAEPVQEPVAKVELMTTGGNAGLATRIVEIDDHLRDRLRPGQLLYTTPPQCKPLTEEEIKACEKQAIVSGALPFEQRVFFARAIERAHGIGVEK